MVAEPSETAIVPASREAPRQGPARVVLVTGLSGAGKSSSLKQLEDLGYEAVDNLPLSLLRHLLAATGSGEADAPRAVAVGVDSRTRDFRAETFVAKLDLLSARPDFDVKLVFFDCDDEVLGRRYTETRRRHPQAGDRPVMDGIRRERELLERIRDRADLVIDTTHLSLPELRRLLADWFALDVEPGLTVTVTSFSYRHGLPREADLVFDVRFLANPYYVEELRELSGLDPEVGAYIAADPNFTPFFDGLSDLLLSLLPHYHREGKSYLTVAVGCTGGRHRSVFVAKELAERLGGAGHRVSLRHRDVQRKDD